MSYADHGVGRRPGCTCWRCYNSRPWPSVARAVELKWDLTPVLDWIDADELKRRYGIKTFSVWRSYGVPDLLADALAVQVLRVHPAHVWSGWWRAAMDYYDTEVPTHA